MTLRGRRPVGRRGQSMVEFAMVVPLLMLLFMGLFDLGRAVYAFNTVSNAARAGARVAIVNQDLGKIQATAARQGVALGIDPGQVRVAYTTADGGGACAAVTIGCVVEVTVEFTFEPVTPLLSNVIGGPITVQSTTRQPVENTGS